MSIVLAWIHKEKGKSWCFLVKENMCNLTVQITCPARERNEEQRAQFQADVEENYPPETLVFLDESACNRMTGQ
jgi:hypothetical protein